jgi:ADP-ribose pyrophosphatase YjhB (NUDIX family)
MVKNIFVPGLVLGSAHLPYEPAKAYAYACPPKGEWRVYLRSVAFIHPATGPFRPDRFVVVKKAKRNKGRIWEPPKGQMEGKDLVPDATVMQLLEENMRREVQEEAKITNLLNVRHTGLVFEGVEPDFPPNTYFQYHVFQAFVEEADFESAQTIFSNGLSRDLPADQREKDGIDWYRREHGLYGRWAPSIVQMYLRAHT